MRLWTRVFCRCYILSEMPVGQSALPALLGRCYIESCPVVEIPLLPALLYVPPPTPFPGFCSLSSV